MKSKIITPMLLVMALCLSQGCTALKSYYSDPNAVYTTSAQAFATTVTALADLREAGALSEDDVAKIDVAVTSGYEILTAWKASLDAGESYDGADALGTITTQLIVYLTSAEVSTSTE